MGTSRESGTTQTTSTREPTPEEREMMKLQLAQMQETMPIQTETQKIFLNLAQTLGTGTEELPGWMSQLTQGISPEAMATQAGELTRASLPRYQQMGIMDSGSMMQDITGRIANQLVYPSEQFNIGTKQNLLNLALGGQAQIQQPMIGGQQAFSQQLQGLRPTTDYGFQRTRGPGSLLGWLI